MAMKGHKKGCACVGCSPATRKRGMAALHKALVKEAREHPKFSARQVERIVEDHRKKNPKRRRVCASGSLKKRRACRKRVSREIKHLIRKRRYPVKRAVAAAIRQERKGRLRNPPKRFIGSNVTLYVRGSKPQHIPGSHAYCGPGEDRVTIAMPKGREVWLPWLYAGAVVTRADYDNRGKALRAYGKPGRFRHDFKTLVKVVGLKDDGKGRYSIMLGASSPLWRED